MKKEKIKRYFKNCFLKYTVTTRNFDGSFNYFQSKHEDVLIVVTEGKQTIDFIITQGAELKVCKTRVKSKKFEGVEISKQEFQSILRERKFEVFESIETIQDQKIKEERLIDYNNFPNIYLK